MAEAFRFFLDENALQLPAGQKPTRGMENIYQSMKSNGNDYILSWEPQEGNVAASGDLGYTWGIYKVIVKQPDGSQTTQNGKYLNVWKYSWMAVGKYSLIWVTRVQMNRIS